MMKRTGWIVAFLAAAAALPGCGWAAKDRKLADLDTQVHDLQRKLAEAQTANQGLLHDQENLRAQMRAQQQSHRQEMQDLGQQKSRESNSLLEAQRQLSESLKKELGDAQAKLAMTERGLVLTLLDEIFFDSGKAVIKESGYQTLHKVAQILKETVPDSSVAVEGNTDNEPIKYSGWRTNWELSSARALAVVHCFADNEGLAPQRLRAVGVGEFHPVASNNTPEGRRQNRRVEIVILPSQLKRVKS